MTDRSSKGAALQSLNVTLPEGEESNSVHNYLDRVSGHLEEKVLTLTGTGATSENLFQVTGSIEVYRLWGEVVRVGTLTNLTGGSFDLYDSTSAVQLSAATGVLSGVSEGTVFTKTGLAADAFAINNSVAGAVLEQTYEGSDPFNGIIVTQKNGANTFLRFTYTTTDNPIDADIVFNVEYRALDGGMLSVA